MCTRCNPRICKAPGAARPLFPSDELQPFVLHIADLSLRHQDPTVQCERHDVGGDLPCVFLGFEGQDDLIVRIRHEFEGGEAVGWVERADAPQRHGAEVRGARQQDVGGAALVRRLVVTLVAGTAREKEPALQPLAPCRRLVDEVPCKQKACDTLVGPDKRTRLELKKTLF